MQILISGHTEVGVQQRNCGGHRGTKRIHALKIFDSENLATLEAFRKKNRDWKIWLRDSAVKTIGIGIRGRSGGGSAWQDSAIWLGFEGNLWMGKNLATVRWGNGGYTAKPSLGSEVLRAFSG